MEGVSIAGPGLSVCWENSGRALGDASHIGALLNPSVKYQRGAVDEL